MQVKRNKAAITIALILTFTIAMSMIVLPVSSDAWPTNVLQKEWPTWLFISTAPNPVGVSQTVTVNMIFANPTPTARGAQGDAYEGVTVDIVRPDGTKETMGPFTCDFTHQGGTREDLQRTAAGNLGGLSWLAVKNNSGVPQIWPGTAQCIWWRTSGYEVPDRWSGSGWLRLPQIEYLKYQRLESGS